MKNIVALICARGGSKGLPGKNIRPLAGIPLIGWAIKHAASVDSICRIIVSTDSVEIGDVAKEYGAEVPFVRPAELAQDNSPEWQVWQHALEYIKKSEGAYPDLLVVVPVTAPLRSSTDIEMTINEYNNSDVDVVITVTDSHRSPYFNMVKLKGDGCVELVMGQDSTVFRRQDSPAVYDITTVAYVVKPEFVLTNAGIFEGKVRAVKVPTERALDIDTLLDFNIAECLIGMREQNDNDC